MWSFITSLFRKKKAPAIRAGTLAALWLILCCVHAAAQDAPPAESEPSAEAAQPAESTEPSGETPPTEQGDELIIELTGSDDVDAAWELARDADGKIAGVFPSPIRVEYKAASLLLLADSAVIWVTPREKREGDVLDLADDFLNNVESIEIYAEGSIWLRYGEDTAIQADRLYLDLAKGALKTYSMRGVIDGPHAHSDPKVLRERSLLLDETTEDDDGINPFRIEERRFLFLRAKKLKIFELTPDSSGRTVVELEDGRVTGNSLAVPSYAMGADRIRIELTRFRRTLTLDDPSVYLYGTRIFTLPITNYLYDLDSEFPRTRFTLSDSDAFGSTFRFQTDVITAYDFFFDPQPTFRPFQFSPQIDTFSERGVGLGAELFTGRERDFGDDAVLWMHGYHIRDDGDRREVARDLGYFPLRSADRGRFLAYGRASFPEAFQLEGNVHYASDPAFIEEFERDEFKENYPRRTFIFGRKDFLSHSFFIDVSPRIRPFTDEVERLPVAGFMTWREPVGPRSLGLLMSADGTAGYYRIQTADHDHPFNNYDFLRADTKLLLSRPMDFGLFSLEPGFGLRVTASDRKVTAANNPLYDPLLGFAPPAFGTAEVGEDIASRIQTVGYLDWQTNFVRTWPGEKGGLLGLNGLRHIVTLQNRWENVFSSSASASDFLQTDEVSALDPAQRLTMSVRNRFQTRRRIPGTNTWRTEDMLDVLAALPVYPNSARDNGGERLGDLEISAAAKPHPYVRVQSGTFWDTREFEWRRIYGTARVNVREDLALNLHWRLMESRHEVIGASFETLLSHNYAISARQDYDVRAGKFRDTVLTLARHTLDAFAINFTVRRDAILEDLNFGLSISGQFGPRRK